MPAAYHLLRLVAWRTLLRDPLRTAITVLGVALGVAVVLAIRLANGGVLDSFRVGLDHVAGKSRLQVSAGELGFDETLFPQIAQVPGVAKAVPLIQELTPVEGFPREVLLVLGVDILADSEVREYRGPSPELADPLQLLTEPDAILVPQRFARAHGLQVNGRIRLLTPRGVRPFTIRGLLADEGIARVMDGQVAVMDIAAAQEAFQKIGRLDRVEILLAPGADAGRVRVALKTVVPPEVGVERPEARNAQVEQMLGSFQLNLFVLSLVALFVGVFLVYNTMSVSVVRQRRQLSILRSLGVSRLQVLWLVLAEGAVIGLAGSALGIALGLALAQLTLGAISQTVSSLYAFVRPGRLSVDLPLMLQAALLGVATAIGSSLLPALDALRATPCAGMSWATLERRHRPWTLAGVGLLLGVAGYGFSQMHAVVLTAAGADGAFFQYSESRHSFPGIRDLNGQPFYSLDVEVGLRGDAAEMLQEV